MHPYHIPNICAVRWCQKCTILVLSWTNLQYICCKFSIIIKTINAGTAPSYGAIWDAPKNKKKKIMPNYHFFGATRCIFKAHIILVGMDMDTPKNA